MMKIERKPMTKNCPMRKLNLAVPLFVSVSNPVPAPGPLYNFLPESFKQWFSFLGKASLPFCNRWYLLLCFHVLVIYQPVRLCAAQYFIDYSATNDSANGTTMGTPWKRHPYMVGFSGSYSHAAGDRFIFKGGVTWPRSVFQMNITAGGSSDSVRDYYGVDAAWYTGGDFSKPVFDFEHTVISGFGTQTAGVLVNQVSYITFDSLVFTNHTAPVNLLDPASSKNYGSGSLIVANVANYVTATNCSFRDWNLSAIPTSSPNNQDGGGGFEYVGAGGGAGMVATHCDFDCVNVTNMHTGDAMWNIGLVEYCVISNTSSGYRNGLGTFRYNTISNGFEPTDPNFHANAIQAEHGGEVYGNVIHDLHARWSVIAIGNKTNLRTNSNIYNNVVWNAGGQNPITLGADGANTTYRVYNNTLVDIGPIRVVNSFSGSGVLGVLDARNNHFITSGTAINTGGMVTTLITSSNLTQTAAVATSAGYTVASIYQPTSVLSPTVNTGTNVSAYFSTDCLLVSRPVVLWDIGAYEFAESVFPIVRTNARGRMFFSSQ